MEKNMDVNALASLLKPIDSSMLTDSEWEELIEIDADDGGQLSSMFQRFILPEYESMDARSREIIQDSLRASLAQPSFDYSVVLNRLELPFPPLEQPRSFFLQLWRTLNGTEFA